MGAELPTRDLDASASGAAERAEWRRRVASGCWPWVAGGCRAHWGGGAPFTVISIMPTNYQLLAPGRDLGSAETRTLLERWGHLHAVRTTLSVLAALLYLWLLLGA